MTRDVMIDYTNWRGERGLRRVRPVTIYWGNTQYHPEFGWLLIALDVLKGERRTFSMKDIHSWRVIDEA